MPDDRLKRAADQARQDRAVEDTEITQDREMSDDERISMLTNEFVFDALPNVGQIPGFHLCWLTTQNSRDTIQYRMRLGYVPVKAEELPGFETLRLKSGEYEGFISVNEMLLFKIPLALWERYMRTLHHDKPNQEEEKLKANTELVHNGKNLARDVGDGYSHLSQPLQPVFR